MKTMLLTDGQNLSPTSYIEYDTSVWVTLIFLGLIAYFAIRVWWSLRKDKKIETVSNDKWRKPN